MRWRILQLIYERPGTSVSEVARDAGCFWTTAALHVEHLRRAGLVATVRAGRRRVLFPTNAAGAHADARLGILGEPACRNVAASIVRHPDLRVWELCNVTGMSERAVYHHVKRLVEAGLVSTTKTGAYRGLQPTPRLLASLSMPIQEDGTADPERASRD